MQGVLMLATLARRQLICFNHWDVIQSYWDTLIDGRKFDCYMHKHDMFISYIS